MVVQIGHDSKHVNKRTLIEEDLKITIESLHLGQTTFERLEAVPSVPHTVAGCAESNRTTAQYPLARTDQVQRYQSLNSLIALSTSAKTMLKGLILFQPPSTSQ